ncbi:hypothetical protein SAMD00023353_1201390 [Rosellinia necatrix]|uniref:Alpha beta hydrolase fold-1 protein n=1 Tax=Rosellinia necatrix TaxID=77044 RepID=A0A1W2TKD9_ROSNE|nr:hypothetical protein SAMD00023353_1201390 [Rosellinia necatrix]
MKHPFAFGTDLWDPSHRFETSWLVSPYVLFVIRALLSLYAFTTLLFNIGYNCARPSQGGCATSRAAFSYFTVLSYWGLAFYFLAASAHTLSYAARGRPWLDRFPRPLQALHALFYSTATTFPFLVVVVFWALLSSPATLATPYSAWSNVSQHALNAAFALVEIALPRTRPQPWAHLPFLVGLLALYLALAYLTHATKGFYTYSFLDPALQGPLVAAYVFGIAVGICVVFALARGLVWLRCWVTEEKLGLDGVFAHHDDGGAAAAAARVRSDEESGKPGNGDHELSEVGNGHMTV